MASFEIKDCPTKLTITETEKGGKKVQTGMLTLDIRNASDRRRTGRIRVEPGSGAKPEWFSIDGAPSTSPREIEQDFAAKGQQSVRVNLAVPAGEPAKSLLFNALVTAEDDPDNDFVKGPNVAFDIAPWKEAAKPKPQAFPWWIVAVAVVLVIVVGGIIAYLMWPKPIDVVGLPLDQAMTKLEQAGTKAADITAVADTQAGGHDPKTVVRMERTGDKVKLVYDPGVLAPLGGKEVMLVNVKTGKCLTIAGGTLPDNNIVAVQFDCDGDPSRRWTLRETRSGIYQIRNVKTGKCLTIAGGISRDNNVKALQFDCDGDPSRTWRFDNVSGGSYQIRNVQTDKCLTIAGGTLSANNIESVQFNCDDDASRRWTTKDHG
jgi:hypothetical protein